MFLGFKAQVRGWERRAAARAQQHNGGDDDPLVRVSDFVHGEGCFVQFLQIYEPLLLCFGVPVRARAPRSARARRLSSCGERVR